MKKNNKTYHLEDSGPSRISNSPGRIIKNQTKSIKEKHSQRHNGSSSQSRKEEFQQINKRVEQKLQKNHQLSKKTQKSVYQQNGYMKSFVQKHESSSVNHSQGGRRTQQTSINPYEEIYHNDMKYFQEYLNSTAKYEYNGINLNWPYYFSKNHFQSS